MTADHAADIRRVRDDVASAVGVAVVARGEGGAELPTAQGPTRSRQDLLRDLDFLEAAVMLDQPVVFSDYALWRLDRDAARGRFDQGLAQSWETVRVELAARLTPAATAAADRSIDAGLRALRHGETASDSADDRLLPQCRLYVAVVLGGRRDLALAIVQEEVGEADSPIEVYVDIFQSALYEVGRRWSTARLTIAEEHMATATTEYILGVLHDELPHTPERRGTAVVAGVLDEQHMLGASIVANVLEEDGWDVHLIGTNLSNDAITSAVRRHGADLLAISATLAERVDTVRDLIAHLHTRPNPPRVIVGGAAFRRDPDLWRAIGADGCAIDARGVAELARG